MNQVIIVSDNKGIAWSLFVFLFGFYARAIAWATLLTCSQINLTIANTFVTFFCFWFTHGVHPCLAGFYHTYPHTCLSHSHARIYIWTDCNDTHSLQDGRPDGRQLLVTVCSRPATLATVAAQLLLDMR